MNFKEENTEDWINIQKKLFPYGVPTKCEWTKPKDIAEVLSVIGETENSNHMFYPTGGGLDIEKSILSKEDHCIEIDTGGLIDIIKPSKLIFHSFDAAPEWYYFRIDTLDLEPSGVYGFDERANEELVELSNGEYIDRSYWDQGEYRGETLSNARIVTRHFKGYFVIFQKTSIYNSNSSTYDGRHNAMSDEEFRIYIQKAIYNLKKDGFNN